MKTRFRALALCLVLGILVCILSSCTEKIGTGHKDTTTVLKVDRYNVTMDEYRYLYYKYRALYEKEDPAYFTKHPEALDTLKANVLDELCTIYALYSLADEYGVSISDDVYQNRLNGIIQSYINDYGSEEAYFAAMEPYYLTGDLVRAEEEYELLKEVLFQYLCKESVDIIKTDDATIEAQIAADAYFCVRYLCILDNGNTAESAQSSRNYAQKLADLLADGSTLQEVYEIASAELSKQTSLPYYMIHSDLTNGEYYIKGYLEQNAERTVLELPVGAYSGVVEINGSYFVYERMEPDQARMQTTEFSNLRTQYASSVFSDMLAKRAEELHSHISFKKAYTNFQG